MKFKKCPARKHCFDYKDNNCDNCDIGNEFTKLHKRIDRLKKQNETLTIQRNAWALTAKALGEKWISVDERLPDERPLEKGLWDRETLALLDVESQLISDDVLVVVKDIERDHSFVDSDCTIDGKWQNWEGGGYTITHWMSKPEPPKEKGGAE